MDVFDPGIRVDPYPTYHALRARGRVHQDEQRGFWIVTGYEEVVTALKQPEVFSSTAVGVDAAQAFRAKTMLSSDPPDHTRLRGAVARSFTPRAIAQLEPRVAEVAHGLLAGISGEVDLVESLAFPLPVVMIAEMLGVEPGDAADFRRWSNDMVAVNEASTPEEFERARAAAQRIRDYLAATIERRRVEPSDDLVGRFVAANDDGALDDDELLASCVLLLVAGNETTTNLISNAALWFGRHPEIRAALVADPSLLPAAIEEVLRFDGPVQATMRLVQRDTTLGGQHIPAGDMALLVVAGANRDPQRFPDPDVFDPSRDDGGHVAFGHGIHFCLGSVLARLEARIGLGALLHVAPDYRLADEPLAYGPSFFLRGLTRLPVTV